MFPAVAIVEDDAAIREHVAEALRREGMAVAGWGTAADALRGIRAAPPSLVILDLGLPDADGLDVCRELTRSHPAVPVLILTARDDEETCVRGLNLGADDFMTKPFRMRELLARIQAILRRRAGRARPAAVAEYGRLAIDFAKQTVYKDGKPTPLTAREFRLLTLLARQPGRPFTRDQILDALSGAESEAFDRAVDQIIKRLRAKIEDHPSSPTYIETVWGVGYRFTETP
jgi:DNA-binding response OmpR family regulator